jgi:hypothetical protein
LSKQKYLTISHFHFFVNSTREEVLSAIIFPEANPSPIHILDLPPEMHLEIFALLDHTTSVCLGLTNKNFSAIYKTLHPVPHRLYITMPIANCYSSRWITAEFETPSLPFLLDEWMGSNFAFCYFRGKFINKERSQWVYYQWKQSVKDRAMWVEEIRQLQIIGGDIRKYCDPSY